MIREAENKVKIEGILSEIDINYGSFERGGQTKESIGGSIKVKVAQTINGENVDLEVPVHMFATKMTNAGKENPAYQSIEKVLNTFVSIAAAGGEAGADRVRITSGKIRMNEYYNQNGNLVSFPRIEASFINKIKKEDCRPEASFVAEIVVGQKGFELDADGVETDKYVVKGVLAQYGEKVDVINFVAGTPVAADHIQQYWTEGDTVKIKGRMNFSSKTEVIVEELGFGEANETVRTQNVSELLITGGSNVPLDGEFAYDMSEIQTALAQRKARLEAQKEKDMSRNASKAAPAENGSKGPVDLGF